MSTTIAPRQDSHPPTPPPIDGAKPAFGGMAIEFESESGSPTPSALPFLSNPALDLLRSVGPIVLVLLIASILVRAWSKRTASKAAKRVPWRRSQTSVPESHAPSPNEPMIQPDSALAEGTSPEDALRNLRERAS
ncbi:MAG: hypothetical protein EXS10_01335 [Phycisphaerales bacterium]|nr:hypothetical protein [Phycisphaerales bacterium]